MSDNFASNRAAAAFESLRRGFDGVKGPDLGMFVIDPLRAETPEMRAERKAAESPARQALNAVLMTVVLIATGLVLMGAGIYIGATDPTVWTELPFTPEPSGERAEPEESAR